MSTQKQELRFETHDDYIALLELVESDTWPILLKYIEVLSDNIKKDILTAEEDRLVRLRGQVDGAEKLMEDLKNFKHCVKESRQQ